jgi:hypothetical protein
MTSSDARNSQSRTPAQSKWYKRQPIRPRWWFLPALVPLLLIGNLALLVWFEDPLDDTAGFIKNLKDPASDAVVTLQSFDPDLKMAHFSVDIDSTNLAIGGISGKYTVEFGKGSIVDDTKSYLLYGATPTLADVQLEDCCEQFTAQPPSFKDVSVTAVGDPRLYPFDRYVIVGLIKVPTELISANAHTRVLWTNYEVKNNVTGYVVSSLSVKEALAQQPIVNPKDGLTLFNEFNHGPNLIDLPPTDIWISNRFVLSMRRPIFIRIIAVLLAVTAIALASWIAFKSDPSEYIKNAAGYLVAMWGAKSIIGGAAPKTPSILDYLIIVLFLAQTIIVATRAYPNESVSSPSHDAH